MIRIIHAIPRPDYLLEILLDDGRRGIFDVRPYLDKGVFRELQDYEYFSKVAVRGRSLYWPHAQDFCADTIAMELQS